MERKENSILNSKEYHEGKLILKSRPRVLFLELTRNCNLHCTMCRPYNWYRSDWFMNEDILEKVRKELFPYVDIVDLRGFGESSLDNRLINLSKELNNNGVRTMLYSNLGTQDESYWDKLVSTGINIAISIESGDNVKYSKIRRGGNLDRVKKNIIACVKAATKNNLPFFTTVLSDDTLYELKGLIDFAHECGIKKIQLNPISIQNPKNPSGLSHYGFLNLTKNIVKYEFDMLVKYAKKKNVYIELGANMFNENNVNKNKCLHPWSYVFVRYDGEIGFCDHLVRQDTAMMGNIGKSNFMNIWNSEKYIEVRKSHLEKKFKTLEEKRIECEWCDLNRYANCEGNIEKEFSPIELEEYIKKNLE
ncbi:radical SAM protein [Clostridium perfringens]|uniref:radical SAM protein n=1 Tax=Clostridium perfringens TaxID=1502 RepID=UPI00103BC4BD|nr:radical SAM protein [Clostridium perfringens]TBX05616.1 hypothetical protein BFS03_13440 [Clostridium perfringens]